MVEFAVHFVWFLTFFSIETIWTNQIELDMSTVILAVIGAAASLWIHESDIYSSYYRLQREDRIPV